MTERKPVPMEPTICPTPNDWSRYSLDQIWTMLQRQSPETGQTAAELWSFIEQLCSQTATQLATALRELEAHWPRSQHAARMFQLWGKSLVEAMQCTAQTAVLNRPVVQNITEEITSAKGKVADLLDRAAYYQAMELQPSPLMAGLPHLVEMGREVLEGDGLHLTGWRTSLSNQAREVMVDLEQKIFNYARGLHADPPYEPPLKDGIGSLVGPEGGGPSDATGSGWGGGGFASNGGGWSPPGGWGADDVPFPDEDGTPPGGGPAPGGGSVPGRTPSGGGTVLDGGASGGGAVGPGGVFVDTPWGRVLSPGGVIGAGPSGAGAVPGGSGGLAGPAATGLIAGTSPGGRGPAGSGMVPFMPPMMAGQPAPTGGIAGAAGRRRRRGLPSVFETPQGPPAVIQPDAEPTEHDPGPGVIGIDR